MRPSVPARASADLGPVSARLPPALDYAGRALTDETKATRAPQAGFCIAQGGAVPRVIPAAN